MGTCSLIRVECTSLRVLLLWFYMTCYGSGFSTYNWNHWWQLIFIHFHEATFHASSFLLELAVVKILMIWHLTIMGLLLFFYCFKVMIAIWWHSWVPTTTLAYGNITELINKILAEIYLRPLSIFLLTSIHQWLQFWGSSPQDEHSIIEASLINQERHDYTYN